MSAVRRLGTVIGLLALSVAGARAGDARKSVVSPAEGLKPCRDGGFPLPDSATCLRLGGDVEAVATVRSGHHAPAPTRSLSLRDGVHARLTLDARTPTALGPLRVYTSIRAGAVSPPDVLKR